jgi:exopolysaccharide production protein ExoY
MTTHYRDLRGSADSSLPVSRLDRGRRRGLYRTLGKRTLDYAVVLLGAPFVVPVLLVLALAVYLRDGSNPFYSQDRVGKGGGVYRIWKLRTMVVDADLQLAAHLAADPVARKEWDRTQKLRDDPRITRIGRFLRKSSLDELPQLWNVLKGDMTLVGPRPMMPEQRSLYPGEAYYRLLPGITGPWQVSERNETTFAARAEFDTEYEISMSLATDVKLLIATTSVVARGTGY